MASINKAFRAVVGRGRNYRMTIKTPRNTPKVKMRTRRKFLRPKR